jgi:cellobiose-specific phosphotransferase system component IIC
MKPKTSAPLHLADDGELSEPVAVGADETPAAQETETSRPIESQSLSRAIQVGILGVWFFVGFKTLLLQLAVRECIPFYLILAFAFLLPGYLVAALIDACSYFTQYGEDITARRYYLLSVKALFKNLVQAAISSIVAFLEYFGMGETSDLVDYYAKKLTRRQSLNKKKEVEPPRLSKR